MSRRTEDQDLTGLVVGRWTVLQSLPRAASASNGRNRSWWLCRCECGTEKAVEHGRLVRRSAFSCGCAKRRPREEMTAELARRLFNYDQATGVLIWVVTRCRKAPAGARAGRFDSKGYRVVKILGRLFLEHRIVWLWVTGEWPKQYIDHINGDRSDNRWHNLRDVSASENLQNQRLGYGASGMLGVSLHKKRGKWQAQIKVGGKAKYLGLFDAKEQAHQAYVQAKRQFHPAGML